MIVFFRHGKTVWNLEKRLQGSEANSELLPVDEEYIEKVKTEFQNILFDEVIVSPSKRAVDFCKILNLNTQKTIIEPQINEISFGVLTGKKWEEIPASIIKKRNENKWLFRPQNGESYEDLYNRLEAPAKHLQNAGGKNIAIVGHETANKVLIGKLINYSKEEILQLKQGNETLYKIENNTLYRKIFLKEEIWEKL